MRILWISSTFNPRLQQTDSDYNGGGWISSLQRLLVCQEDIQLAIAYCSETRQLPVTVHDTTYYAVYVRPQSSFQKLKLYYGGYRNIDDTPLQSQLQDIVKDFRPDLIQVFGIEDPLATVVHVTDVPCVIHLQGILGPISKAYFPPGTNMSTLLRPFSVREAILRNGLGYAKRYMDVRAKREERLFQAMKYCMGRTEWDWQVTRLLSPGSTYLHCGEVLRDAFYRNAGKWTAPPSSPFRIVSTISETFYKGLDFILNTACLLKEHTPLKFQWLIVGMQEHSLYQRIIERIQRVQSATVDVEYCGVLTEHELADLLLSVHVYVHASYIDNSSNSLCEAQMLGVPVIGTYVGGIPSLVKHGETGYLVPTNAPYDLAHLLCELHDHPDRAAAISANAAQTARCRHDKQQIVDELLSNYRQIYAIHQG